MPIKSPALKLPKYESEAVTVVLPLVTLKVTSEATSGITPVILV